MGQGRQRRLYADAAVVTLESGEWVARFFQAGLEQFVVRPSAPAAAEGKPFVIRGVRFSVDVGAGDAGRTLEAKIVETLKEGQLDEAHAHVEACEMCGSTFDNRSHRHEECEECGELGSTACCMAPRVQGADRAEKCASCTDDA